MYVQSIREYMPASQVDMNEHIIFETSTSTSTTVHTVPMIEERVKLKSKTPEEIKKHRAFERQDWAAKKKANFETSTSTSTTSHTVPAIEERVKPVRKSPEEIKKTKSSTATYEAGS